MVRCARLARHLFTALPVVWWDDFLASWHDIGWAIAEKCKRAIDLDGVMVRLVEPMGNDGHDAPLRDIGGVAAGTGSAGD